MGWKLYTALLIFNNLSGLQHDPLICQRQVGIGTVTSCCTMKASEQLYPFTVVLTLGFLDGSLSNLLWHVVLFCQFIAIRFCQVWASLNHLNPISGFGIFWNTWDLKLRGSLCEVWVTLTLKWSLGRVVHWSPCPRPERQLLSPCLVKFSDVLLSLSITSSVFVIEVTSHTTLISSDFCLLSVLGVQISHSLVNSWMHLESCYQILMENLV